MLTTNLTDSYIGALRDYISDVEELSDINSFIRWITGKNKDLEIAKKALKEAAHAASQWLDHGKINNEQERKELKFVLDEAESLLYND